MEELAKNLLPPKSLTWAEITTALRDEEERMRQEVENEHFFGKKLSMGEQEEERPFLLPESRTERRVTIHSACTRFNNEIVMEISVFPSDLEPERQHALIIRTTSLVVE